MSRLYKYRPLNLMNSILAVLNGFLDFKIHFAGGEQEVFYASGLISGKVVHFFIFMHKVFDFSNIKFDFQGPELKAIFRKLRRRLSVSIY